MVLDIIKPIWPLLEDFYYLEVFIDVNKIQIDGQELEVVERCYDSVISWDQDGEIDAKNHINKA